MSEIAWEMAHSVEARVRSDFAWQYMTDVSNWDDPPASFSIEGPFAAGSRGTTHMPGEEARRWYLREVSPPHSYVVETALEGAVMSFEWQFEEAANECTRLTAADPVKGRKHRYLSGAGRTGIRSNLAAGMEKIASAMEQAAGRSKGG